MKTGQEIDESLVFLLFLWWSNRLSHVVYYNIPLNLIWSTTTRLNFAVSRSCMKLPLDATFIPGGDQESFAQSVPNRWHSPLCPPFERRRFFASKANQIETTHLKSSRITFQNMSMMNFHLVEWLRVSKSKFVHSFQGLRVLHKRFNCSSNSEKSGRSVGSWSQARCISGISSPRTGWSVPFSLMVGRRPWHTYSPMRGSEMSAPKRSPSKMGTKGGLLCKHSSAFPAFFGGERTKSTDSKAARDCMASFVLRLRTLHRHEGGMPCECWGNPIGRPVGMVYNSEMFHRFCAGVQFLAFCSGFIYSIYEWVRMGISFVVGSSSSCAPSSLQ